MASLQVLLGFGFEHQEFVFDFGQTAEEQLWNRMGLIGGLPASEDIVGFDFGTPFLSRSARTATEIEQPSLMASRVISRSPL